MNELQKMSQSTALSNQQPIYDIATPRILDCVNDIFNHCFGSCWYYPEAPVIVYEKVITKEEKDSLTRVISENEDYLLLESELEDESSLDEEEDSGFENSIDQEGGTTREGTLDHIETQVDFTEVETVYSDVMTVYSEILSDEEFAFEKRNS